MLVTGGAGFLGRSVVQRLRALEPGHVSVPRSADYDLTQAQDVHRLFADEAPDTVLHLAAEVGGIGANRDQPGRFFYANMAMGLHLIEQARLAGIDQFVQVGTICAYPKHTPVPFREDALWSGYPEETNAPYGIAKKALLVQLQAYRAQYGLRGIYLLPVNLYGPGDNFDSITSHVIPALIRRMTEARESGAPRIELWGTGRASREFLHVDDCSRAILLAAELYDSPEPVNVGTGEEITIAALAERIAEFVGYDGELDYNRSMPDGQPRRCLDTTRALESFGFRARIPFLEGLEGTVNWYRDHRAEAHPKEIS